MFVYERERDTALVVGAGIPDAWLNDTAGIRVSELPTYYGLISYVMQKRGNAVRVDLTGRIAIPRGGVAIVSPLGRPVTAVLVNGVRRRVPRSTEVTVRKLPASVEFRY
jgi:hypothetical protein